MALHQYKNTFSPQRLPVVPVGQCAFLVLVFFLWCMASMVVPPVTALDPGNQTLVSNLVSRGSQCYYSGDYPCAWAAFESAHQLDPGNAGILYVHGYYLSLAGNTTGALEKMDAALALDPRNAQVWYERGKVLDKLGRYAESGSSYDQAEALNPALRVPATGRFPWSVLFRNAAVIVLAGGFALLGIFIYFRERRRAG